MLKCMAPHALQLTNGERHDFQSKMLGSLSDISKRIVEQSVARVALSEEAVAEAEAEKVKGAESRDVLDNLIVAKMEHKAGMDLALDQAKDAEEQATQNLQTAQKNRDSHGAERTQTSNAISEHEKLLAEAWEPLKAGDLSKLHWRSRDKLITRIVACLEHLRCQESLQQAIQAAMKLRLADRGKFTNQVIEFTDDILKKHEKNLQEKLANWENVAEEQAQLVVAAQSALDDAVEKRSKATTELQDSEKNLADASEQFSAATAKMKSLESELKSRKKELETTRAALDRVRTLVYGFEALQMRVAEPPANPPAEVAPAAPVPMPTNE